MFDVVLVVLVNLVLLFNLFWNGLLVLKLVSQLGVGNGCIIYYFIDDQGLVMLGLKLVVGCSFIVVDVEYCGFCDQRELLIVMLIKVFVDKLFLDGSVLGKVVYLDGGSMLSIIIGLVDCLQVLGIGSWINSFVWNFIFVLICINVNFLCYVVCVKLGWLQVVMQVVFNVFYGVNCLCVMDDDSVKLFVQICQQVYCVDVGMVILMGVVCLILLGVIVVGIVGLISFWVGQCYCQIGVWCVLGVCKIDILYYFQMENLLIFGVGVVIGLGLVIGLNMLLMQYFEMDWLLVLYVLVGIVVVMVLGQGVVFVLVWCVFNVLLVVVMWLV